MLGGTHMVLGGQQVFAGLLEVLRGFSRQRRVAQPARGDQPARQRAAQRAPSEPGQRRVGRPLAELVQPVATSHRRGVELAAVVAKATAVDPEQRYDSVGALQRDQQRLLAHRPITALQGQRAYLLSKGLRRRWPWALAAVAALALTAALSHALARQLERAQAATTRADQAEARTRAALARALGAEARAAALPGSARTPTAP